jgi:hypothetical protein
VTDILCSFCGIAARQLTGQPMIAGPKVYICAGCVQLCAEIIVEQRDSAGGLKEINGAASVLTTAMRDLEDARRQASKLEAAVKTIAREVAKVLPGPHAITCMWCGAALDDEAAARDHVATCAKHPAVVELAKLRARRSAR